MAGHVAYQKLKETPASVSAPQTVTGTSFMGRPPGLYSDPRYDLAGNNPISLLLMIFGF